MKPNKMMILVALFMLFVANIIADDLKLSMDAKKNLRSANMYYGQKNYVKSKKFYDLVLEENPEYLNILEVPVLSNITYLIFAVDKDYYKAMDMAQTTLDRSNLVMDKYEKLKTENPKAAKKFYKKVIKKNDIKEVIKNNTNVQKSCWARLFKSAKKKYDELDYKTAFTEFKELYKARPDSTLTIKMLALSSLKMDDNDKAQKYFQKLADIDKTDVTAVLQLATMNYNSDKYEEAVKWYAKAANIDPKDENNYFNMGLCYDNLKNYEKALEMFKKTLEINPNNVDALLKCGYYTQKLGDEDSSLEYLKRAIAIDPNNKDLLENITTRLNLMHRYAEALEYAGKWKEVDPDNDMAGKLYQYLVKKLDKNK